MTTIDQVIELIDQVLKSKKSKLSKKDRETLIIAREKLKAKRNRRVLYSVLKDIATITGAAAYFIKDS